jgi:tripartite-type tricarboxylate transporter receptor subunit TctC
MPQLPTMAEAGPANLAGFESQQWFALFGPAALPKEIVTRLNNEVTRWLESPEVRTRLSNEGAEPGTLALDQFAAFIRTDAERWKNVIRVSGAKAD